MNTYIQISKLNDFIFCPYSLYFHSIYDNFAKPVFQRSAQLIGTIKHEKIDNKKYGNSTRYLVGVDVFSEKYRLSGRIDIYDKKNNTLIERKNYVNQIFDGYKFQLYGQKFCLEEMGYKVEFMHIYSMKDNKKYFIDLPSTKEILVFKKLLKSINNFDPSSSNLKVNQNKCLNCIYSELCHIK